MTNDPFPGLFAGQRQESLLTRSVGDVVRAAIRDAVAPLSIQLEHERQRADRAEQRADEALAEARDLRRQLGDAHAAERIARDEAAGLRAELDARKQWGFWRRVRGR